MGGPGSGKRTTAPKRPPPVRARAIGVPPVPESGVALALTSEQEWELARRWTAQLVHQRRAEFRRLLGPPSAGVLALLHDAAALRADAELLRARAARLDEPGLLRTAAALFAQARHSDAAAWALARDQRPLALPQVTSTNGGLDLISALGFQPTQADIGLGCDVHSTDPDDDPCPDHVPGDGGGGGIGAPSFFSPDPS